MPRTARPGAVVDWPYSDPPKAPGGWLCCPPRPHIQRSSLDDNAEERTRSLEIETGARSIRLSHEGNPLVLLHTVRDSVLLIEALVLVAERLACDEEGDAEDDAVLDGVVEQLSRHVREVT